MVIDIDAVLEIIERKIYVRVQICTALSFVT